MPSDSEDEETSLTSSGQELKDLLKTGAEKASGDGGDTEEGVEYIEKRDLGGNIIRVRVTKNDDNMKDNATKDTKADAPTHGDSKSEATTGASDAGESDKKRPRAAEDLQGASKVARTGASATEKSSASGTDGATRLTEAAVQEELIRYGGRMKTRDLLQRFRRFLKTGDDKALFRDILRTIATVETDPIDGRILVLKDHFM